MVGTRWDRTHENPDSYGSEIPCISLDFRQFDPDFTNFTCFDGILWGEIHLFSGFFGFVRAGIFNYDDSSFFGFRLRPLRFTFGASLPLVSRTAFSRKRTRNMVLGFFK